MADDIERLRRRAKGGDVVARQRLTEIALASGKGLVVVWSHAFNETRPPVDGCLLVELRGQPTRSSSTWVCSVVDLADFKRMVATHRYATSGLGGLLVDLEDDQDSPSINFTRSSASPRLGGKIDPGEFVECPDCRGSGTPVAFPRAQALSCGPCKGSGTIMTSSWSWQRGRGP